MHFGEFRLLFWQETKMYLRKKATLIGVFGKSGCLFTETQIISPKKGNRKSGYREKGLLFPSNAPENCGTHARRAANVSLRVRQILVWWTGGDLGTRKDLQKHLQVFCTFVEG
jgi:hypothetical protein